MAAIRSLQGRNGANVSRECQIIRFGQLSIIDYDPVI